MRNNIPENIEKLLKSIIIEDIILGVNWCYINKGQEWCSDNFNSDSNLAKVNHQSPSVFLEFDDMDIFIGTTWIDTDMRIYTKHRVINFKTK